MKWPAKKVLPESFSACKVTQAASHQNTSAEPVVVDISELLCCCCEVPCFRSDGGGGGAGTTTTMSDFLKSAMNYFNAGPSVGGQDNEFVGQIVEISNVKLRIKRVIAEGGLSFALLNGGRLFGREFCVRYPPPCNAIRKSDFVCCGGGSTFGRSEK